jgi:hypothetical protein
MHLGLGLMSHWRNAYPIRRSAVPCPIETETDQCETRFYDELIPVKHVAAMAFVRLCDRLAAALTLPVVNDQLRQEPIKT